MSARLVAGSAKLIQQSSFRKEAAPGLPILNLANIGRSSPELERQLPPDVPILREPFTADELRAAVTQLLADGKNTPAAS
jgi:hypothetical protein